MTWYINTSNFLLCVYWNQISTQINLTVNIVYNILLTKVINVKTLSNIQT